MEQAGRPKIGYHSRGKPGASDLGHDMIRRVKRFATLALGCLMALAIASASAQPVGRDGPGCGENPADWCSAPPGDPCGRHKDVKACKADPRCVGMPYHGESVVACKAGDRGFSPNCPTVGCRSAPPGTH